MEKNDISIFGMAKTSFRILFIISNVIFFFYLKKYGEELFSFVFERDESYYCTSWANSQVLLKNEKALTFSDSSLRQVIRTSIGGEKIRIKISNLYGEFPLEIKSVSIANTIKENENDIEIETIKKITFDGKEYSKIPPGEEIYSDLFPFFLQPISDISISIFFGKVPTNMTGHNNSMSYSYLEGGNKINKKSFSTKNKIAHWYFISGVEIFSKPPQKAIVFFGDSTIDSLGVTYNITKRWTDYVAEKLVENESTSNFSVINQGISQSYVTVDAPERFVRDVLEQRGVKYVVVDYGIDDIAYKAYSAEDIISIYKEMIEVAHEYKLKIYGCTLVPFANDIYKYLIDKDIERKKVNKWIRKTKPSNGGFDAVIDINKVIIDPLNDDIIRFRYDIDGLNPNDKGFGLMMDAINETFFTNEDL